jgi:tetratricopeptide (TPR) repeat protein
MTRHQVISMTGYDAELQRIEAAIASFGENPLVPPVDPGRMTQYVYLLYQRASLAGDFAELRLVEEVIDGALSSLRHPDDLYLLKANIAFKLHCLADAAAALGAMPGVCNSQEGRLLLADLDFQRGNYREAEAAYCEALDSERSWGALARLAHFRSKMGDSAEADRLYCEAEDELTAKEMRSYAWIEVQRGFLAFTHGNYRGARVRYQRAETAYPGYWLVQEYSAELLGAEGKLREAIDILKRMSCLDGRPDLQQAIGELWELAGRTDSAARWQRKALSNYLRSVQSGEVHFLHHLADYAADVANDGAQAVAWARSDLQLRENFSTQSALAWAYYRNREFVEARFWIDRALGSGGVEAHLLFRAATVYAASGDLERGRYYMERAMRLNPCVKNFHIHH